MKGQFFIFLFIVMTATASGQNQIRINAGSLSTKTSASEYYRGLNYFYYDSVILDNRSTMPQLNIEVDIDLGNRFYLTTGLAYTKKGFQSIHYINGDYWYPADQEYLGLIFQIKYHYKLKDKRFGFFGAGGFKNDFAVGGPTYAEIVTVDGADFFHAFGTFKVAEFSFLTNIGISYKFGPGEIQFVANFQNGLSDVLADRYIKGKTFAIGGALGYSLYL